MGCWFEGWGLGKIYKILRFDNLNIGGFGSAIGYFCRVRIGHFRFLGTQTFQVFKTWKVSFQNGPKFRSKKLRYG